MISYILNNVMSVSYDILNFAASRLLLLQFP